MLPSKPFTKLTPSAEMWLMTAVEAVVKQRSAILPEHIIIELKKAGMIEKTLELKITQAGFTFTRNHRNTKKGK